MLRGSFDGLHIEHVAGYKISLYWNPLLGFEGSFYIYVLDIIDPQVRFPQRVEVGRGGAHRRGTLELLGNNREYVFNNIDLISARTGATRRSRYRLLEFRYDQAITTVNTPATILNNESMRLAEGALAADYQYALSDAAEHLLAFSARVAAADLLAVRFSALRNNSNCFLRKMIDANDALNSLGRMNELTVHFAQFNFAVTAQNLGCWHIDESFGLLLNEAPAPLEDIIGVLLGHGTASQAVRLHASEYTPRELLEFDMHLALPALRSQTVETSTFVFNRGYYEDFSVT